MTGIPTGFAPGAVVEATEVPPAPTTLTYESEAGELVWHCDPKDTPAVVVFLDNKMCRVDADEYDLAHLRPRELALFDAILEHSLNRVRAERAIR